MTRLKLLDIKFIKSLCYSELLICIKRNKLIVEEVKHASNKLHLILIPFEII